VTATLRWSVHRRNRCRLCFALLFWPPQPLWLNHRGIAETQEMLDFCGKHNITADVEVIPIQKVNEPTKE